MKSFTVDFGAKIRDGQIKIILAGMALLLMTIALAGCGSKNCENKNQTSMPVSSNGKTTIYENVYVRDHYSKSPISGAYVDITNEGTEASIDSGYTDSSGYFVGSYQYFDTSLVVCVAVSKDGYVSQKYCNIVMDAWKANGATWADFEMEKE